MIEQIIMGIGKLKNVFSGTRSAFKIGDLIELKDGTGYPLLILEIDKTKHMKEPMLYCRWYDHDTKETRYNFFHESKVKPFSWEVRTRSASSGV